MGKRKALLKRRASNDPSMGELNAWCLQDKLALHSSALYLLLVTSEHRLVQLEGEERERQSCHPIVTVAFHNFQITVFFSASVDLFFSVDTVVTTI